MKKKASYIIIFGLLMISLLLGGCVAEEAVKPTEEVVKTDPPIEKYKVINQINGQSGDKSFFDSAIAGVNKAEKDFDLEVMTFEAGMDPAKWGPALEDAAANEDFDILLFGGFQMVELMTKVAPMYPDKKFVLYDVKMDFENANCSGGKCNNVYSITYKQNEGSYLAGYYAGLMTQTDIEGMKPGNTIGVLGGQDIPVINDFIVGFKQGAKDAGLDPEKDVIVQYAGTFDDPAKGKEVSLAMYQQGADIIFQVAGVTGLGVFQAAHENGNYAIGVDSDQYEILKDTNPEMANTILTSMVKNIGDSLYRAISLDLDGKLPLGSNEALGVKENGVALAYNEYYKSKTPDDVQKKMEQLQEDLIAEKIVIESVFD